MLRDKPGDSSSNREARPPMPCCSVGLKPANGGVCAVLWTCIEGDDSARRGSMHRIARRAMILAWEELTPLQFLCSTDTHRFSVPTWFR
jgi:hypothetical protein